MSSACKTCVSEDDSPKTPTCYSSDMMRRNTGKDSKAQEGKGRDGRGGEGKKGTGLTPFLSLSR